MHRFKLSLLAVLASGLAGCTAGPEGLLRSHAYEGPARPRDDVATVFTAHSGLQTYFTLVCEVDGKSYRRMGFMTSCPSVVYLLPGKHQLSLETRFGNLIGNHSYEVTVDPGRVYQIVSSLKEPRVVDFDTRTMPQGYVLTYRDIGPFFFQGQPRADALVPIEGN